LSGFIAAIRRCVSDALALIVFAVAMAIAPICALAAPYADFVIDARTGEVLHQTNADARLHPASLTKMMTLYIAFQAIERGEISLDTVVTVTPYAAGQAPSRLGLKAGQKIALRYLIRAAAIKSANDAAAAIGDAIEGDRASFAKRMNRTAKALGMTRTTFQNANGLTASGHLSTARDMTTLGRHLFYDFPQYYSIFSRRSADAGIAQVASTNRRFLDSYEGADGIKTGYTGPAGFNLVASAQRGNKRIIATVFGGKSTAQRNARVVELLDLGFGKAPNRVKEQPPAAPEFMAEADTEEPADDLMAEAVAGSVAANNPAAGKTIRVSGAITESPRPKARGASQQPLLAAATIDGTSTAADDEIAAEATDMAAGTDELMASMTDDIAAALAEAQETPEESGFVPTTAPQPETLVLAEAAKADAAETPVADATGVDVSAAVAEAVTGTDLAPTKMLRPASRPAVTAVAEAEPATTAQPVEETALADATAIADAKAPRVATEALAAANPEDMTAPEQTVLASANAEEVLPEEEMLLPETPAMTAVDPQDENLAAMVGVEPAPAAKPKPEPIVLAEAVTVTTKPAEQEVVTRVSTSGGREWGINVGSFNSRYAAEKQLLQTALVEISTLNDSLRKVTSRKGAFDANFVGMTQETAQLACRRLQARGTECKVLGAVE
jgi:D-alanyl-D-alanine carboxypeptidase